MEELVTAFGIDWKLIVIQVFNFTLLMAIMWYFLYTPLLNLLKERQEKVEKGVRDAEAAERALMDADTEKGSILTDAHAEAEDIVGRAKGAAEEKGTEVLKEAENKAGRTLRDAKSAGEEIKEVARKESEAEIAKVAILATERLIRKSEL